ncbi:hypothetical protein GCM10009809_26510 [Isoptericola hypogeus]|uniref:ABC-2 type transport system permease protein n=1 Tax=Isoptericola hypogeus TaxID=300179 RepID=A0ABN2JKE0_9MICO
MSVTNAAPSRVEREAFAARVHARAVRKVTRYVAAVGLFMGAFYWGIFLVVTVALPVIANMAGGVLEGGAMVGAEYSARWFAFSVGIAALAMAVTTHLAAGGTRRALWLGSLRGSLAVAVPFGAALVVGLVVEGALFEAFGWTHDLPRGSGLTSGGGWLLVSGLAEALVVATYLVAAMALGAAYYSHGALVGTLWIPFALVLLLLTDGALRTGAGDDALTALLGEERMPGTPVVGFLAGLLLLAVATGWFWSQLRSITLRPAR